MKVVKKIPYGNANYKSLIESNSVYVDKTKYIEIMEEYHSRFLFFLRPRRFGKSLLLSMLDTYYDINQAANFDKYFGEQYIGKNKTPKANGYYVLFISFSGLNTDSKDQLMTTFKSKMINHLDEFLGKYKLNFSYDKSGDAPSVFSSFLSVIAHEIDGKLYVLIDEYDHFANELLSFHFDLFTESVSKTGFVRKFYEVLKDWTTIGLVQRIFATGVSPITLDSMTSGFNIADDVTRNPMFNEMMGFTEQEVSHLIDATIKIDFSAEEKEQILNLMRTNYNGYLFDRDAEYKMYNSDMALYFLKEYSNSGKLPRSLVDRNILSDYSKLGNLFDLKDREQNINVIKQVLENGTVSCEITEKFSFEKEFESADFKSLLFYMGYLTIKEPDEDLVKLGVPNQVMHTIYFGFFKRLLEQETGENFTDEITKNIKESVKSIAAGDMAQFIKFTEKMLCTLSNRDYMNFDEKYIKVIMLNFLFMSNVYYIKSEYEASKGYVDIYLKGKRMGIPTKYDAIIEIKYIKQADFDRLGDKIVQEKLTQAKAQINTYHNADEFLDMNNLKRWAVVFVNSKCVCVENVN